MWRIQTGLLPRQIHSMGEAFVAGARQALVQTANFAAEHARATPLFKNRTGALRASIKRIDVSDWKQKVVAGGKPAPYGLFVHNGTRPHLIVGNPTLTFVWKGVRVHFRYVNHPGTQARPFMQIARDQAENVAGRFVQAGINSVLH